MPSLPFFCWRLYHLRRSERWDDDPRRWGHRVSPWLGVVQQIEKRSGIMASDAEAYIVACGRQEKPNTYVACELHKCWNGKGGRAFLADFSRVYPEVAEKMSLPTAEELPGKTQAEKVDGGLEPTSVEVPAEQVETASSRPDSDDGHRGCMFRRSGSFWKTAFDGPTKHLQDLKGMLLIHHLLRHPGQDVDVPTLHAVGDLMGPGVKATVGHTDSGPVMSDEGERASYEELRAIEGDLDKAKRDNNLGEIGRLTKEKEEIVAHLVKAKGLGGRRRLLGSDYEKLVNRVGRNIRNALEKIRQENEPLWRHLDASLRTGDPCSYRPEKPVDWQL